MTTFTQLESSKVGTSVQVCLALESKLLIIILVITLQDQNRRCMCGFYYQGPGSYLKSFIIERTAGLDKTKFSSNIVIVCILFSRVITDVL